MQCSKWRSINLTHHYHRPPLCNAFKAITSHQRLFSATCLIAAAKTHRHHRDGLCSYARPPQWSCHTNMPTQTCPVVARKVPMLHSQPGVVLSFTPPAFTRSSNAAYIPTLAAGRMFPSKCSSRFKLIIGCFHYLVTGKHFQGRMTRHDHLKEQLKLYTLIDADVAFMLFFLNEFVRSCIIKHFYLPI